MVKLSGFTIVRNASKLDFPIEASIRSILPVCDEVVVNVGRSEDDTLELVRSIRRSQDPHPRNRLGHDPPQYRPGQSRRCGRCAPAATTGALYIQADEVLHERGAEELAGAIEQHDGDPRVEGLLVRYLHFYGGFDTVATHRRWYRREVRAVRLDPALDIRPYQGAQGFRVGPEHRKIRARLTDAEMFHYGWASPAHALREKRELGKTMYPWRDADASASRSSPGCRAFARSRDASGRRQALDRGAEDRSGTRHRPAALPLALPAVLHLRCDRAADRSARLRVPQLQDRLSGHGILDLVAFPLRSSVTRWA